MTTPQNVLNLASIFIGFEETPNGSSPFGHWYGERDFWSAPWCAMFVSFCTYVTGLPLSNQTPNQSSKGFALCETGMEWFKKQELWYETNPQPGDIVFYDFYGSGVEHTGIVKSAHPKGITTIEGNTSELNQVNGRAVQQKERDFSSSIIGFGRPAYDGNDIGAIAKEVPPVPNKLITVSNTPFSSPNVLGWKLQMQHRGWAVAEVNNPTFTDQDRDLLLKFQTLWNLKGDGELGPMSWALTWLMPIKTENLEQGDYGDGVYRVQEALKRAGFNITVDGDFGSNTEATVKQFQQQQHLTVDGQVGKETLAQLKLSFNIA